MTYRIYRPTTAFTASKKTAPVKDKTYLDFIRSLPCMVECTYPVEAAHISTGSRQHGHLGRGKGTKASDRWTLPLTPGKHYEQHQGNEGMFWAVHGINQYVAAMTLHGLYTDMGEEATSIATELILKRELGRHGG